LNLFTGSYQIGRPSHYFRGGIIEGKKKKEKEKQLTQNWHHDYGGRKGRLLKFKQK
jgi:hypothetical protein